MADDSDRHSKSWQWFQALFRVLSHCKNRYVHVIYLVQEVLIRNVDIPEYLDFFPMLRVTNMPSKVLHGVHSSEGKSNAGALASLFVDDNVDLTANSSGKEWSR